MAESSISAPPWRRLFVIALLGVALRLGFGLLYWNEQVLTRDEQEYLSLARSLASGHGFVYDVEMKSGSFTPFGRAPGYPSFLALIGAGATVVDHVPARVQIAQSIVGGLGVLMAGLIGLRLGGPRSSARAALVTAVYPPLVWTSAYAFSEALFWPCGLALAWLFDRARDRVSPAFGAFLACGLLAGGAILIRPALLLFLPLAALYLLATRRATSLVALALGVLVVLGPWTLRNHREHGRWMIVASDGGVTFWTGNHPLATGEGDMAANLALKLDNDRLRSEHPGLTEEQMEPIYYREALGWIGAHPLQWLGLECKKLFYLVVPIGPSYTLHSARYYVATWVSYAVVMVLAVVGFWTMGARRARTPGLWMLAGSAVLVCLVFFPQERFRIPIIDPVLVIVAGVGLAAVGGKNGER
jgi:4-amino-4-deoxy-L-arabinose transferase-like glycosyltransferase